MDAPLDSLQTIESSVCGSMEETGDSDPVDTITVDSVISPENPAVQFPSPTSDSSTTASKVVKKKKKRRALFDVSATSSSSFSVYVRVGNKRRNPRILMGLNRRSESEAEAIALPLGMSIAGVFSQMMERKDEAEERKSVDHLSMICTMAVRESLAKVFGDKFDCFVRNFEKSFGSTLMTLRLINGSPLNKVGGQLSYFNIENCGSNLKLPVPLTRGDTTSSSSISDHHSSVGLQPVAKLECLNTIEERLENIQTEETRPVSVPLNRGDTTSSSSISDHHSSVGLHPVAKLECLNTIEERLENIQTEETRQVPVPLNRGDTTSGSSISDHHSSVGLHPVAKLECLNTIEERLENMQTDSANRELTIHGQMSQQLACVSSRSLGSAMIHSVLSTLEKSLSVQAHSNDLKALELSLSMKKMKLKETQLALNSNSYLLERMKFSMGISKASFKAEKFKNQVEDTRHAELLRKCIDCLVAGLLIMCGSLVYGAYIYSYERITEATATCSDPPKKFNSWWIPKPMASVSSGFHMLWCQVQVLSRMMFGLFMIVVIAYLLLQRSSSSKQTMPITFIVLLLGVVCGVAGKFCVDTLGGNGYHWLYYWEALCLLHFFSNICLSGLFLLLHGPVTVSQESKGNTLIPYWIRRTLFYAAILLFLPLLCGLMPFASPGDWKDHFLLLVADSFSDIDF